MTTGHTSSSISSPEYSERQKQYAKSNEKVGTLSLKINDMDVETTYKPSANMMNKTLILNVVVLGFEIKTHMKSGENRNKGFNHDFTVLGYKTIPLYKNQSSYTAMTVLPEFVETAPRMAVSAWINNEDDMSPIQAVGGWLDE